MRALQELRTRLSTWLLASPERVARASLLPGVGESILDHARRSSKRSALLTLADARAALSPTSRQTLELYGHSAHLAGLFPFAIALFDRAGGSAALSGPALLAYIESLRVEDLQRAIMAGEAAIARFPQEPHLLFAHAVNLWLAGRRSEALEVARKAAGLAPDAIKIRHFVNYVAHEERKKPLADDDTLVGALRSRHAVRPRAADTVIGILDYKSPDYEATSGNIGDHIQSLAMLRHVARYFDDGWQVTSPRLAAILSDLRSTWRDGGRRSAASGNVTLVQVDRDYADAEVRALGDRPVWMPVFGWFMHPPFGCRPPFPYPANVRPFFISFHLNKPDHLSPELVAYLRRFEPVGCRDWSTVYWLRNAGVDAFFSGCVTLTLALPEQDIARHGTLAVDASRGWLAKHGATARTLTHQTLDAKSGEFASYLDKAVERLREFQSAENVVTTRLHCYLPCLALGVPVSFRPNNPADRRFDGLRDLDPEAHARLRQGIETKLRDVLGAVLEGQGEAAVYALWRRLCADDVATAKARLEAGKSADQPLAAPAVVSRSGSGVDIAMSFDRKILPQVPTVINSIAANTKSRVRFHLQTRSIPESYATRLAKKFPQHEFRMLPMDGYLKNVKLDLIAHTTVATMDRLFLPDLLPDIDRLLYLDIDIIVRGDVRELYEHDVGTSGIAARASDHPTWRRQANVLEIVAARKPPELAAEARRLGARDVDLMANAFNAGVLVLSLDRLRALNCTEITVGLAKQFGMNDQYALNMYSRGAFAELPWYWNALPYHELVEDAKLIHWAGPAKPWADREVRAKAEWQRYSLNLGPKGTPSQPGKATAPAKSA
ncbi:MAG: glycosyltransferase [Geminicoccaceae bacterium]